MHLFPCSLDYPVCSPGSAGKGVGRGHGQPASHAGRTPCPEEIPSAQPSQPKGPHLRYLCKYLQPNGLLVQ